MRKLIIAALAATVLTPSVGYAQSAREVRQSQREVRQSERDLRDAQWRGDRGDVRDARREVREDRQELREDWRDYRRTHQNVYRRPVYTGPRGYQYRPVVVGQRFAPAYYGSRYQISDPWTYRLPRPGYGYQRWVRYGNDVVLIDTRSGRAIRAYNRFFY